MKCKMIIYNNVWSSRYAQDANGGIWRLDLSFSHTSIAPEKLFSYHAGSISGCVVSPVSHVAVTAGMDSELVLSYMFPVILIVKEMVHSLLFAKIRDVLTLLILLMQVFYIIVFLGFFTYLDHFRFVLF